MAKQHESLDVQAAKLGRTAAAIKQEVADQLAYSAGKSLNTASKTDVYNAFAGSIRQHLLARWQATQSAYDKAQARKVYYLSLEFLIGRSMTNAVINLDLLDEAKASLNDLGNALEEVRECEPDAGLGNGGLGRLAACFVDSMATLQLPGFGFGIRYDYGMFAQSVAEDGAQSERPDYWLTFRNQWEVAREDLRFKINFGGRVASYQDAKGETRYTWVDADQIFAVAHDIPIPGNKGGTVNHLRLWAGRAVDEFNLKEFNQGHYVEAVARKNAAENLSRVLYPDDTTEQGKELRLKQQYFFVSASLQNILADHLAQYGTLANLADKAVIQMNDTHPTLAVAELMRLLLDEHGFSWADAWNLTTQVLCYTNHTLLPEALETWPVRLFDKLLPRHIEIIYAINHDFLAEVGKRYPGDFQRMRHLSIISDDGEKRVRMANLAIVGSRKVNGVAELHSDLMQKTIFSDFHEFYPGKLTNVTNGVTPRRWLKECNPGLAALFTKHLGREWENNLKLTDGLKPLADDTAFRNEFARVKRENKQRLADLIEKLVGVKVSVDSLFDVQVKRIHEYKRQLLNVLHVVSHYNFLRKNPDAQVAPRTVIIAGKAAAGYVMAKRIIKLINNIARVVNNDPVIGDKLKLIYLPNYNVSMAQIIMPAADLSEQISTAGLEASGTGNMKMSMNGALTIGTLDGANIEIMEEAGPENIFIFGLTADEVIANRNQGYRPDLIVSANAELREVLGLIRSGHFSPSNPYEFVPIVDTIEGYNEHFQVLADYQSYIDAQKKVSELYLDQPNWIRKAILNSVAMGKFSSDRSIQDYADRIWNIKPVVPDTKGL